MQSAAYVALSGQVALQRRMETIAHNVANASTAGFRAENVSFRAILSRTGADATAFASRGAPWLSREAGEMKQTGNPLDVAVQGEGWLAIRTPDGVAYTRDGRMRMLETGELRTLTGHPVLDAGDTPVVVDPAAGTPAIARDGMLTQNGRQIGALGLFRLPEGAPLTRYDTSSVMTDAPAAPVLDFVANGVAQGFVESAYVNPVMEVARLMMVTRAFESVSRLVETSDTAMQEAIRTLGGAA